MSTTAPAAGHHRQSPVVTATRSRRGRTATALAVALLVATAGAAALSAFDHEDSPVRQALATGGARLKALQNPDGGWYFYVGDTQCGFGPGVSCPNTLGVTGLGLLAAAGESDNHALVKAAVKTGTALVAMFAAQPTSLPKSQHIEFLVALAHATDKRVYAMTAAAWFQNVVTQYPHAADRVDALLATRDAQGIRTLGAWDAAALIRAAVAVGKRKYAIAAAQRVVDPAVVPLWQDTNPSHRFDQCANPAGCGPADNPLAFDYTLLAEGSLLWALDDLPDFAGTIRAYRSYLIGQQDPAGSWDVGDFQITAYVTLGLDAVGGRDTRSAIRAATDFLLANQLPSGGWNGSAGVENTEVDAEVLQALAAVAGPSRHRDDDD